MIDNYLFDLNSMSPAGGFQISFQNGNTISVQFHYGNYCDNRDNRATLNYKIYRGPYESQLMKDFGAGYWWACDNAEIAIWDAHDVWYDFRNDQVIGYQSKTDVAEYIEMVNFSVSRNDLQSKITERGD